MNENKAKQVAKDNGLKVSSTKYEIKVGNIILIKEGNSLTNIWKVKFNNQIVFNGQKSYAILTAVKLQAN